VILTLVEVSSGVGTPGRLSKLLSDSDSLDLSSLKYLVIDATHEDAKRRTLLDSSDVKKEFFEFLANSKVLERLKRGEFKIILF
jgi:protein CMS1